MIHYLPITKARINLGQVVRRVVRNKEYFILEKDGIPVAGILGADELEDYLELRDPKVKRAIEKSNEDIRKGKTRPAEKLLAEFRKENAAKRRPRSRREV
jgi:antitoxin (DNA-binding transcriptional repressor) of toxin-antitoxin stability system